MRFTRTERYQPLTFTDRKRAAFARKQQRERERYPLFAEHVASEQHSAADEIERRQRRSERSEQTMRNLYARIWREARARFHSQPEDIKAKIRDAWAAWTGPTTCKYFSYVVDLQSGLDEERRVEMRRRATEVRRHVLAGLGEQCALEMS